MKPVVEPYVADDGGWAPIGPRARASGRVLVAWIGVPNAWTAARYGADAHGGHACWRDDHSNPLQPSPTHWRLMRAPKEPNGQ